MEITCPECGKSSELDLRSGEVNCPHCGEKLWEQVALRMPEHKPVDRIGKYDVVHTSTHEAPFGMRYRQSMYRIYLAEQPVTGRKVEIRIPRKRTESSIERCYQTARLMAQLDHPNIPTLHDVGEHEGLPYLALEYVDGPSLIDIIRRGKQQPTLVVLRMMAAIAGALEHAHGNGVIHGDVRPSNIVVSTTGRPVLCGFETSPFPSEDTCSEAEQTGHMERYASPESMRGQAADAGGDIWGLGATMYHLVSGRRPYEAAGVLDWTSQIASPEPIDVSPLRETAPEFVVDVTGKCLQKDPDQRYASAEELKRALEAAVDYVETSQIETTEMPLPRKGQTILLNVEYQEAKHPGAFRSYEIGERIGGGSYGDVYRAVEKLSGKTMALKILRRELVTDSDAVARFRREATLLSRLSHPNIVHVHNFGRYGATFFMAMDLLGDRTLANVIEERSPMELKEAFSYLGPALEGLSAMHEAGIVHRDLKPDNIAVSEGKVVVFDFGMAHSRDLKKLTVSGMFVGTPYYASPEQAAALASTGATDVYAAGVVLYEMLTGKYPHEAETSYALLQKIVAEPPVPISERRPNLPAAVVEALDRMLAKNPDERPSASEARQWLAAAAG